MKAPRIMLVLTLCFAAFSLPLRAQDKDAVQKELDKYGIKPGKDGAGLKDEPKKEDPKAGKDAKKEDAGGAKIENKGDVPVVVVIKKGKGTEEIVQLGPQKKPSDPEQDTVYESTPLSGDATEVQVKPDPLNPGPKGKDPEVKITHPNGYTTVMYGFGEKKPVFKGEKVYMIWNMSDQNKHQAELIKEDGTKQTVTLDPHGMQLLEPGVIEVKSKGIGVWEIDPKKEGKGHTKGVEAGKDGSTKIPGNKTISMSDFGDGLQNGAFASAGIGRDVSFEQDFHGHEAHPHHE